MKNLVNIKGAVSLNNIQQKEVNGGAAKCSSSCAGRPIGARCYYLGNCLSPGECSSRACIPY